MTVWHIGTDYTVDLNLAIVGTEAIPNVPAISMIKITFIQPSQNRMKYYYAGSIYMHYKTLSFNKAVKHVNRLGIIL